MIDKERIKEFISATLMKRNLKFYTTEYIRTSCIYWSLGTFKLLNEDMTSLKAFSLCYLNEVYNDDGGYGQSLNFPSTITATLSALQTYDLMGETFYDEKTEDYLLSHLNEEGSCKSEDDNRLVCCIILSLVLLNRAKENKKSLNRIKIKNLSIKFDFDSEIEVKLEKENERSKRYTLSEEYLNHLTGKGFDKDKIINFILQCYNDDGGFGMNKGAESHAAQVYCCIAILRSFNYLDCFDKSLTVQFLSLRQNNTGGLTGRPDKLEDVCYSYWTFSSLYMLGSDEFIDKEKLIEFVYKCHEYGFADRPGNQEDLFHTMYALSALSLLKEKGIAEVDPGLCV
ncbi:hypothetical protein H311_01235 [Anncaliia algerae PRA109]|nr:hypothetical protein H311_01235 [Anncaliia algerae PRA109]